jgi:lipopolysaccharide/colanic/teichoic acid biosynthesis glycosyltransferase
MTSPARSRDWPIGGTGRDRLSRIVWLKGGKRVFDTVAVLLAIPIALPLVLALVLVVRLVDGPAPLFRQQRVGRGGVPFTMLKLRTMRADWAPPPGWMLAGWTSHNDPRVTHLGRILRRYRLDETPQLWNVLRGDMSLVGPRPETPEVSEHLAATLERYSERHRTRPGLTGLCQISPDYPAIGTIESARRKLEHDLVYVRTISPGLDLLVLARTGGVLLGGHGVA